MKIFLYNCLLTIILPFMILRIALKAIYDKDYLKDFHNRIGFYNEKSKDNLLWFHAVSLGEVIGSKPLLKKLVEQNDIVLTVSTPTGLREAKKIYKNNIIIVYAPWDQYFFVNSFLNTFNPTIMILFETEIWPSMIHLANKRKIPIFISNARLSSSSLNKYIKIKSLIKESLNKTSLILVQSEEHLSRFIQLGVKKEKIKKCGTTKFDVEINSSSHDIHKQDNLILCSSTHTGEDEVAIESFLKLKKDFDNLKLIIVPRHPERASSISKILKKKNIIYEIKSSLPENLNQKEVIVINATGILESLYRTANIAFIGGSLFPQYGGHNIIEPAANKCAFIIGPYMKNFEDITDLFKNNSGCIQIDHNYSLYDAFYELLNNSDSRNKLILNAYEVVNNNSGSSKKQIEYINNFLNHETSNSDN